VPKFVSVSNEQIQTSRMAMTFERTLRFLGVWTRLLFQLEDDNLEKDGVYVEDTVSAL